MWTALQEPGCFDTRHYPLPGDVVSDYVIEVKPETDGDRSSIFGIAVGRNHRKDLGRRSVKQFLK